jgi:hypothetical protein
MLLADIVYNHTTFRGFTNAYNYTKKYQNLNRFILDQKRLTEAFYTYHLVKYVNENILEHQVKSKFLLYYVTLAKKKITIIKFF